jgi:hypothetical protein
MLCDSDVQLEVSAGVELEVVSFHHHLAARIMDTEIFCNPSQRT